jgi:glycogen operon protein
MTGEDWGSGFAKSVGVFLNGQGITDRDMRGHQITDDSFLLCFNAHYEALEFTLPPKEFGAEWRPVIDTEAGIADSRERIAAAGTVSVGARAVIVLEPVPDQS